MKSILVSARPKTGDCISTFHTNDWNITCLLYILSKAYFSNIQCQSCGSFCVNCIDDLCANDNGVWTRAGQPRRNYDIMCDPEIPGVVYADPVEQSTQEFHFSEN